MWFVHPSKTLLGLALLLLGASTGIAPAAAAEPPSDAPATADAAAPEDGAPAPQTIDLGPGRSFIFGGDRAINRVLVSDDRVAQVKLLEEGQFQVRGMDLGTTDIWVWFRDRPDQPQRFDVQVARDLSVLRDSVQNIVGADAPPVQVHVVNDRLVLEGQVADVTLVERIAAVAGIHDAEFVNLLTVSGDHQVQLEVVFAEVSRSRLRDLGVDLWFDAGNLIPGMDLSVGSTPPGGLGQAFNIVGTISAGFDLMASLKVLEQHNLTRVLARPTLVALSGEKAEFLAGGEVPIPVAQFGDRTTIEFREFGVKVSMVPTVLGNDIVDVEVYVEVSDLDSANSLRLADIAIPGLRSRKSQSHLRLGSGTTFAMAGMLDERIRSTRSKVPLVGDIPVVGALFRKIDHRREETELVIFVTPRLVRPLTAGEVPPVPGSETNNDPGSFELFMLGLDHQPPPPGQKKKSPVGPVGVER